VKNQSKKKGLLVEKHHWLLAMPPVICYTVHSVHLAVQSFFDGFPPKFELVIVCLNLKFCARIYSYTLNVFPDLKGLRHNKLVWTFLDGCLYFSMTVYPRQMQKHQALENLQNIRHNNKLLLIHLYQPQEKAVYSNTIRRDSKEH